MQKKMLFIYNPYSGKGLIKNKLSEVIDIFTKGGYDVTVRPTQDVKDLKQKLITSAIEYDIVSVSGGDGTINEAVSAMYTLPETKRVPIGYIPTGSTNDFALNLSIPNDITEAAKIIVTGTARKCDIGLFNGRPFVYVAGAGAFTAVSYETPQKVKNVLGHSAYIIEGIKSLPKISAVPMEINADGVIRSGNFIICMILNSARVAGMNFKDFYSIDICDGIFEAALIEVPENILSLEGALAAIHRGKRKGPGFEVIRGKTFNIKTATPMKWTLDGEFGGKVSEVNIEVLPNAVTFIGKDDK